MHSVGVFNNYELQRWKLSEIAWTDVDPSKVGPHDVSVVRSAVMGECNSIAALHGFLNEFVDDYDFSAFASLWAYEELQHHFVFRTWLERVGAPVDDLPVESTRAPYPNGIAPAATLATNVISELTVNHAYQAMAEGVGEPVLKQIATRVSGDEARHAREFMHYTRRRLAQQPAERKVVLETLYVYLADPTRALKHPVSVFKGALPALQDSETIDDGLRRFEARAPERVN